jgi:hypothetical protein
MQLNKDQKNALFVIKNWWNSPEQCIIIDGAAGTGKTHLIDRVLKELPRISPIILSPTNEALTQIREKVTGKYIYRTVHSALGVAPTVHEKDIKFEQKSLPSFWDDINLAVVDEVSMLHSELLNMLLSIGVKIILLGHRSQLPPVKQNRGIFDPCISPAFEKGFPTVSLTIPMRNTGVLWEFNNILESNIYTKSRDIPTTFDLRRVELLRMLESEEGKQDLLSGKLKIAMWSNPGVDEMNKKVRNILFGEVKANTFEYLPKDKIILTSPTTLVPRLETTSEKSLKAICSKNKDLEVLFSNTKAEVLNCEETTVKLNAILEIRCYKLTVQTGQGLAQIYSLMFPEQREVINTYYQHASWVFKEKKKRELAYKQKHFILSCFAQVKHYYAATSHRLQGTSIPKVIVINSDIAKNPNFVEQAKCRYVACSRAIDYLGLYRGLI